MQTASTKNTMYLGELERPKVDVPKEISPEILALKFPEGLSFTEEEIAADERLAHALGVR